MTTLSVFVCPSGSQRVATVIASSDQYGTCASGQGAWQSVTLQEPFDPASLNSAELGGAFGAGFTVMGIGLVIAWSARAIVKAFRF